MSVWYTFRLTVCPCPSSSCFRASPPGCWQVAGGRRLWQGAWHTWPSLPWIAAFCAVLLSRFLDDPCHTRKYFLCGLCPPLSLHRASGCKNPQQRCVGGTTASESWRLPLVCSETPPAPPGAFPLCPGRELCSRFSADTCFPSESCVGVQAWWPRVQTSLGV